MCSVHVQYTINREVVRTISTVCSDLNWRDIHCPCLQREHVEIVCHCCFSGAKHDSSSLLDPAIALCEDEYQTGDEVDKGPLAVVR